MTADSGFGPMKQSPQGNGSARTNSIMQDDKTIKTMIDNLVQQTEKIGRKIQCTASHIYSETQKGKYSNGKCSVWAYSARSSWSDGSRCQNGTKTFNDTTICSTSKLCLVIANAISVMPQHYVRKNTIFRPSHVPPMGLQIVWYMLSSSHSIVQSWVPQKWSIGILMGGLLFDTHLSQICCPFSILVFALGKVWVHGSGCTITSNLVL